MLVGREGDLALGQRRVRGIAGRAEFFQFPGQGDDLFLRLALAGFQFVQPCRQRLAFLRAFGFLRREAFHLEHHRVNALVQEAIGIVQRIELALARGDGDFLLAQFHLRLLQGGLQIGLLAQPRGALLGRLGDMAVKFRQFHLQLGDLIFAAQNRGRRLAIGAAVQITAGVDAVTIQQFAAERHKVATRVTVLELRFRSRQIRRDERAGEQ